MFALGTLAATIGSLAGLGGGFIIGPALRVFFHRSPETAASASLIMVLANVSSASFAFLRQGRIDIRLALTMGLLAIPGSILGAIVVASASAAWFDLAYSIMLACFAFSMLNDGGKLVTGSFARLPWARERTFVDRISGRTYRYTESPPTAVGAGLVIGFFSSFFGIGGGVFVVPLLLRVFAMPAHIVSATSHAIILFSVPFGIATHALRGSILWNDAFPLAAGGLVGGQLGAGASRHLSGKMLVRLVGIVLAVVAASLAIQQLLWH